MHLLTQVAEEAPVFIYLEIEMVIALLITTFVALIIRRVRFPYTVALVLVGLAVTFLPGLPEDYLAVNEQFITGELILALFIPPLIFEGALHINWDTFRQNLLPIVLMAVLGVFLSTFIVGGVILGISSGVGVLSEIYRIPAIGQMSQIPFVAAVAFGALISATDPVAVIAFFRRLGVDKRLSMLVEGESLLNDGTSIVIFKLALSAGALGGLSGNEGGSQYSILGTAWEFLSVSLGGLAIGLVIAAFAYVVFLRPVNDRLVETTITLPVAFGSYVLAEQFHLSGILAVVAAGIYLGNMIPTSTTPTTKLVLFNFWEMVSFVTTSLVFLIIGWQIDIRELVSPQNLVLVLAAVMSIIIARALVVYGLTSISNRLGAGIGKSYQHIMFWGGLRGAISLALALSLTANEFGSGVGSQLQLMTFGVVLFTLLVQGTTIESLIKRLGLVRRTEQQVDQERYLGRFYAARVAKNELNRLHEMGIVSGSLWEAMSDAQAMEIAERDKDVRDMLQRNPGIGLDLTLQVRRAMLQSERSALADAVRREIISNEILEEMLEELDSRIEVLEKVGTNSGGSGEIFKSDEN